MLEKAPQLGGIGACCGPIQHDPALLQAKNMIREFQGVLHPMRDDDEGQAILTGKVGQKAHHLFARLRIKAGIGFYYTCGRNAI
jgi:hypothetical protein